MSSLGGAMAAVMGAVACTRLSLRLSVVLMGRGYWTSLGTGMGTLGRTSGL